MDVPTAPSRPELLSRWFRTGAAILGSLGALLISLAAPPATMPAAADCIDYSQYWHVISRLHCGNGGLNAVAGNYAFVLEGNSYGEVVYFDVVDVEDPGNPVLLVRSPTGHETGVAMAMSGTHVYCLEGYYDFRCLQIIDVSDPLNPVVDATLATPYGNLTDIAVSGDHVYIAAYPDVIVVDVSNPQKPVVVGSLPVPGVAECVEVFDRYLGIGVRVVYGDDPAPAGLYVADISRPDSPVIVGFVHTDEAGPAEFAITGSHAYLATPWYGGGSTLHVIDLSDPAAPTIVRSLPVGENVMDIILSDTMAYVTEWEGVQSIDISDPRYPRLGAEHWGVGGTGSLSGDLLYLGGLSIVDLRNPTNAAPISKLDLTEARQAVARDQYAYVIGGGNWLGWLKVVDIADPLNPRVVGSTDLRGVSLAMEQSSAYVVTRDWCLREVDVSDPQNPTPLRAVLLPDSPEDLAVRQGIAYVAVGSSGLAVVDCRQDPWWVIGTLNTPGSAAAIVLSGSYAFIADYSAGVQIVDLSAPLSPQIVANVPCGYTWDLAVSGQYLYVAGLETYVIDVSVPTAPQIVSTHYAYCASYPRIEVRGPIAYSCVAGGVEILNVSDPEHLSILGFISDCYAIGVDPEGALAYSKRLGPADAGLYIFWGQCVPTTAVDDWDGEAVSGVAGPELQITPNPTLLGRPTRIRLDMNGTGVPTDALPAPPSGSLEVSIYDATGRCVRRLPRTALSPSPLEVTWDGVDEKGHPVAAGVYFVRAAALGTTRTGKVVITK